MLHMFFDDVICEEEQEALGSVSTGTVLLLGLPAQYR
jgi:hypothetical protein